MVIQDSKLVVLVSKALRKKVYASAKQQTISVSQLTRIALERYLAEGGGESCKPKA
jgi:hypothetical protein